MTPKSFDFSSVKAAKPSLAKPPQKFLDGSALLGML
jgi:hypothetical protein